jgi:hypothetical protein
VQARRRKPFCTAQGTQQLPHILEPVQQRSTSKWKQ